jgi:hypothetical protein
MPPPTHFRSPTPNFAAQNISSGNVFTSAMSTHINKKKRALRALLSLKRAKIFPLFVCVIAQLANLRRR